MRRLCQDDVLSFCVSDQSPFRRRSHCIPQNQEELTSTSAAATPSIGASGEFYVIEVQRSGRKIWMGNSFLLNAFIKVRHVWWEFCDRFSSLLNLPAGSRLQEV
ncbi:hypothetical protein AVEN_188473-1 [Araneus ventricosus]|uniref:Uncharacterized protein n=1 Tax=Araneus ventricosus TaxID=182803 RepID=A0A4Y2RDP6_ARAVE|nr:hypothetical protein AVEN_188473-1 [Araneus ventricosus]